MITVRQVVRSEGHEVSIQGSETDSDNESNEDDVADND